MKKLRTVIIDDEPNAIALIAHYLAEFFSDAINVESMFSDPNDAFKFLNNNDVDLVFCDINMPGIDGMELLSMLPNRSFETVYVTAHAEHSLRAYKHQAMDYILKPINRKEFVANMTKTIERVQKIVATKPRESVDLVVTKQLSILKKGVHTFIDENDILYLRADGSYTLIVLNDETVTVSKNLKAVCENIASETFLKVNRSMVVNLNHVQGYSKANDGNVILKNGYEIGIGRTLKEEVIGVLEDRVKGV